MIKIQGQVARPTQFPMYGHLHGGRQGVIAALEGERDTWYAWANYADFEAWALEKVGAPEPTKTAIAAKALAKASRKRRDFEMALNSQVLLPQLGSDHLFDDEPVEHLPNFDLHHQAPTHTFYAYDADGHLGLHQLNTGAQDADNANRKKRSRITTYQSRTNDGFHAHANVDKDLIYARTDTDVEPAKKKLKGGITDESKKRRGYRCYGDYSEADFTTPDGTTQTMRGHTLGYADTIGDPKAEEIFLDGTTRPYPGHRGNKLNIKSKKESRGSEVPHSKTSNDNPLSYYGECDSSKGGDLGAKVKGKQHEGKTREYGGIYAQANKFSATSTLLGGGLHIPDAYHYLREAGDDDEHPYAAFKPRETLTGTAEEVWESHAQDKDKFPTPKLYDNDGASRLIDLFPGDATYEEAPSTPYFLPDCYERDEENMLVEPAYHQLLAGTDGADSLVFGKTGTDTYDTGRFLPQFQQPH